MSGVIHVIQRDPRVLDHGVIHVIQPDPGVVDQPLTCTDAPLSPLIHATPPLLLDHSSTGKSKAQVRACVQSQVTSGNHNCPKPWISR